MRALLVVVAIVLALGTSTGRGVNGQMFGGDRHKSPHGCIASAGYSWCESKSKCLKIWEEECPTSEKKQKIGGDTKCSNGRIWCETMGQCVDALSMISCPEVGREISSSSTSRENNCQTSAGFMWCADKAKCLQPWIEACKPEGTPLHHSNAASRTDGKEDNEKILSMRKSVITDKMDLAQHQFATADNSLKHKKIATTRRVSVLPGQDTCMGMIEGEELCEKTGTCMPVEDCERILPEGQTNQAGYQHGVKPQCESMVMGVEWCEKAKRCMPTSECVKLDL